MTPKEILEKLKEYEKIRFRNEPEAQETLAVMVHDALISLLEHLSENQP